ncbi:MAG: ribbon-helix-helix protein, CopG family [Magnetococcales bacterium]|nr:ribbon-helix-helix protein, CopG family [Magnetococcales bacterium]
MPGTSLLSVRISDDLKDGLSKLVESTGRTQSFLTNEALRQYLEQEAWQIQTIQEAVQEVETASEEDFIEHGKVDDWLASWGSEDEVELSR